MKMFNRRSQRGFSLIEALVAFLILSVGMLGIASLQTVSLRAGSTAALRNIAVIKAGEIMELIRSNPTQVANYAITSSTTGADNNCSDNGSVAACTPEEMAEDDVFHWLEDLKNALPNNSGTSATVTITPPAAGDALTTVTVSINWTERNADTQTMDNQNYSVTGQVCGALKC